LTPIANRTFSDNAAAKARRRLVQIPHIQLPPFASRNFPMDLHCRPVSLTLSLR
jgi:hypothetical protein